MANKKTTAADLLEFTPTHASDVFTWQGQYELDDDVLYVKVTSAFIDHVYDCVVPRWYRYIEIRPQRIPCVLTDALGKPVKNIGEAYFVAAELQGFCHYVFAPHALLGHPSKEATGREHGLTFLDVDDLGRKHYDPPFATTVVKNWFGLPVRSELARGEKKGNVDGR